MAIEWIGVGAVEIFTKEVLESSPAAGPIVSFVLKNGLSYAFYTFKKQKMNWPFNTETPLTYETLKLGVTFTVPIMNNIGSRISMGAFFNRTRAMAIRCR